jgi:hypothetical protein
MTDFSARDKKFGDIMFSEDRSFDRAQAVR